MLALNTFIRISGLIKEVKKSALANEQIWFVPGGSLGELQHERNFADVGKNYGNSISST